MGKEAVAYELRFDEKIAREGKKHSLRYIGKQIETHLGERFNTLLSSYTLDIKEGNIYGHDMDEPFLDTLKRGQEYRKTKGELIDRKREEAEVIGFEKIQQKLTSPDTKTGSVMLSISPKGDEGSSYIHNFYDIFTLCEDERGRFIEAKRYSSALSPVETVRRLNESGLKDLPFPNDVSLLSNPVFIEEGRQSADEIHALLHEKHEYVDPEDFHYLKLAIGPTIAAYKNALLTEDQDFISRAFNTLLRTADRIWDDLRIKENKDVVASDYVKKGIPPEAYIWQEGIKPVRQVMTGCGSSGGATLMKSPFSISEYGTRNKISTIQSSEWFTCPKCNYKADGSVGNVCPGCGLTKDEYALETGIVCE